MWDTIKKIIGGSAFIALAAWAYRFGGSANGQRWVREVGVGIAEFGFLTLFFGFHWIGLLILGTVWVETTYFKIKGTDAQWVNWLLVGISFALVPLPWIIADGHHWIGFAIRALFIIPFTTILCTFFGGNVQWSEGLRGGMQICSLLLLLLFPR
jgi:hypothetical protein